MKNSKILFAAALVVTMQAKADNLNGSTRNLNVLPLTKHAWLKFSASENDSKNILRDWACNCDNHDFEIVVEIRGKPTAMAEDLHAAMQVIDNPVAEMIILQAYINNIAAEVDNNLNDFAVHNLKEMLFSPGQDGKTAYDILEEKQSTGKPGCIALKKSFEAIKELIEVREHEKNSRQIEVELEKSQQ